MRNICAIFLLIPLFGISQIPEDFGSWTKISFDFKLNKKTNFNLKTELRTVDNSQKIKQTYTQLSFDRKINKNISTSFAWRLRFLNKEYNYLLNNRFHNDLTLKDKIGDFYVYFRLRTQYNIDPIGLNEFYERTRFKLKYNINKNTSTYLYNEFYFLMNEPSENSNFNKNRFGAGLKYKINSTLDLHLKYLRIRDFNIENPMIINIIGLGVSIDLN